jgi:hypothetical protein
MYAHDKHDLTSTVKVYRIELISHLVLYSKPGVDAIFVPNGELRGPHSAFARTRD